MLSADPPAIRDYVRRLTARGDVRKVPTRRRRALVLPRADRKRLTRQLQGPPAEHLAAASELRRALSDAPVEEE